MAHKVKNVNETLDKIKNEAVGFGLRVISVDRMPRINSELVTDSIIDHPIVGREVSVSEIVNMIACFCNQQALTVIPMVGMGGLGKTALAKLVCQEPMERKLFDVKMWVCISDDFDDQRIVEEMWQTLNANAGGITNKEATLQHLGEERVWNKEYEKWDSLKNRLLTVSRNNGKAVIVTTRSEEVASIMETSPQCRHKLKLLSDDECWSIIKEKDAQRDVYENITTFKMHDMVHDLALSISKAETMTLKNSSAGDDISHIRHLNLISYGRPTLTFPKDGAEKLRSLFSASTAFCKKWKFKSLRTLKLVVADIKELPTSIGELKHLRHLDASCNEIKVLPDSLTKLYNLQTLSIKVCKLLEKLPRKLRNLARTQGLASLRKLQIGNCDKVTSLPNGLQSLDDLTVVLCPALASVPQDLQESHSLHTVSIFNCPSLSDFSGDIFGSLSQLKSLAIDSFLFEALDSIQGLPSFQSLKIRGQNDLKSLPVKLQCLTALKIWACENLKYLPTTTAMQRLSKLQLLEISECPLLSRGCVKGTGSEWSKISHISQIIVNEVNLQGSEN
ncbi:hypothetical protein GH714_013703 [Hevea brasiliensis]|uniref:Uncharacterized protein n=1 Tax=Hevea brasiliensis TaxID=3981 RepID=A0A6A6N180_HEVBR|nr:hypothetical protein GH714_013703 [Hevea brasiliensis]